jgi:hypothetical protein
MLTKVWLENLKGIHRHRWKDNIKMDIREIKWKLVDWIHGTQDRNRWPVLVNKGMNLRVKQNPGNLLTI